MKKVFRMTIEAVEREVKYTASRERKTKNVQVRLRCAPHSLYLVAKPSRGIYVGAKANVTVEIPD